jgi:OOP family OmpA-OmpF porin
VDSEDMCPETPYGVSVDEFGCPVDTDKDGVPDYIDECPKTAVGTTVDQKGCPLDSDGDGVVDSEDMCPETPYGVSVDEFGCPKEDEIFSKQKITIPGDDIFAPNSAMIKIEGKKYLDEVILQLQKFTDKKWRIEGHMDSVGDTKSLMTLSYERAKAVLEYFSFFGGLNRENFQVIGMGSNYPLGDNNTEEGRKQNRRIEIVPETTDVITDSLTKPEEEFNQFILRGDDSFESNTATLKELAKILLDEIAAYIKNQPGSRWRIEGYTDNQGSASLQKKITSERAYAIYDYLIAEGLSADQFTVSGLGSSNPIANNDTQEGRSTNRRILIVRED